MNKVVYEHIDNSGKVFYVGCGGAKRAYNKYGRNSKWEVVAEKGYTINIVGSFPLVKALEKEFELIQHYGLENLTNVRSGGQNPRPSTGTKQKVLHLTENLFQELEAKANENRRPVNTEIIIAIENHLKNKN